MAQVSKRWRLDIYAGLTSPRPPVEDVVEALYALGIEGEPDTLRPLAEQITDGPYAGVLVAIAKHLARHGMWLAVDTDGPSFMDEVPVEAASGGRRAEESQQ